MDDPKRGNFTLKKLKHINNGGLHVEFTVSQTVGSETFTKEETVKNTRDPHPDLRNLVDQFKSMLAHTLRFKEALTVTRSKDFKANKDQAKAMERAWEALLDKLDVSGVSLSGQDENRGVIITGKLWTELGPAVALNSPRLKFNGTKYGFEETLEDIVGRLEDEAFEYVFKNKASQLEIFGASDDSENTDEIPDGKMAAAGE